MPIDGKKKLLADDNYQRYRAFVMNQDQRLELPAVGLAWGIAASRRIDTYTKTVSAGSPSLQFIRKNEEPHTFIWKTTAKKLKEAASWGIIKPHSMTAKVIADIGRYRLIAHKRLAKGMISNSQIIKLKLVDFYQARFKTLEDLESLVNKENTYQDFEGLLQAYIDKLGALHAQVDANFSTPPSSGLNQSTLTQLKQDIQSDIQRAQRYLDTLPKDGSLSDYSAARGHVSIMEFVKQQMLHGLYELQGINEDLTYNRRRRFAISRGEFNDLIEDARKDIDQHAVDLHNSVTQKHHGRYGEDHQELLYEFSAEQLSSTEQREALLAISFIEGWDTLNCDPASGRYQLQNTSGTETLDTIHTSKWTTHRSASAFFKSFGIFLFNMVANPFISTRPWIENAWHTANFKLVATTLWEQVPFKKPLWNKPYQFFKQMGHRLADSWNGVKDSRNPWGFSIFDALANDWVATQQLESMQTTIETATASMTAVALDEAQRLAEIYQALDRELVASPEVDLNQLASIEYPLTAGDQNDILTLVAKGVDTFASVFYDNFAKNPVQGVLFTGGYAVGAGAIFLPSLTSAAFSPQYVKWFSDFAYSMAGNSTSAMIAGASIQGQVLATGWDCLTQGPSSRFLKNLHRVGQDPLPSAAYVAAAYGVGHLLFGVLAPYKIPVISQYLNGEIGTNKSLSKLVMGGKITASGSSEAMEPDHIAVFPKISGIGVSEQHQLIFFLSRYGATLAKLPAKQKLMISRQIDALFNHQKDRESLKKLLYPEITYSVGVQLIRSLLVYPVAMLRLMLSPFLSLLALIVRNPHPAQPMSRAFTTIKEELIKHLSQLMVASAHFTYIGSVILTTAVKLPVSIATMLISRVAGLFNLNAAHELHKGMASAHIFFRSVSEFLYPSYWIKQVGSAHPLHTLHKHEPKDGGSYGALVAAGIAGTEPPRAVHPTAEPPSVRSLWSEGAPRPLTEDQLVPAPRGSGSPLEI